MIPYSPQPPTALQRLLALAGGDTARLDSVRGLSLPRMLVLHAHIEHAREMEQLQENLEALMGSPPMDGEDETATRSRMEWVEEFDKAQLRIIEADCCFALPLDHPYGEQEKPRPLNHWRGAEEHLRPQPRRNARA